MDMLAPKGSGLAPEVGGSEKLTQIAQMLGCSPDAFFEQSTAGYPRNASLLIQTWLAIRSPKGCDAVFAFARETLRADKLQTEADCLSSIRQIRSSSTQISKNITFGL